MRFVNAPKLDCWLVGWSIDGRVFECLYVCVNEFGLSFSPNHYLILAIFSIFFLFCNRINGILATV